MLGPTSVENHLGHQSEAPIMAMRLSGKSCLIFTKCSKDGNGHATHVYCISRLKGLRCPLEGIRGAKPFELSPLCFRVVRPKAKKD